MSEHAFEIVGVDEKTSNPVHIALTLVLGGRDEAPASKIKAFAAPRGFLPSSAEASGAAGESLASGEAMAFAAPRGFMRTFD